MTGKRAKTSLFLRDDQGGSRKGIGDVAVALDGGKAGFFQPAAVFENGNAGKNGQSLFLVRRWRAV